MTEAFINQLSVFESIIQPVHVFLPQYIRFILPCFGQTFWFLDPVLLPNHDALILRVKQENTGK
jgi:hypothetical protein